MQEMDNYKTVAEAYDKVSRIELGYRGIEVEPSDCLKDTINSCICIMGRGSIRPEEYTNFASGIGAIQGHIFVGRINGENGYYVRHESGASWSAGEIEFLKHFQILSGKW